MLSPLLESAGNAPRPAGPRIAGGRGRARLPVLLPLLAALVATQPASAAPPPNPDHVSTGDLSFRVAAAAFVDDAGRIVGRVYLEVPYRTLRFSREGGTWKTRFDVTIVVYQKGNQVTGDLWTVDLTSPDPESETTRGAVYRRRFDLVVESGKLRFDVTVNQARSGRNGTFETTLDVPRHDVRPLSLSDLVFGSCGERTPEPGDSLWADGAFYPVANPRYGDERPVMCVEGGIYDHLARPDSAYEVTYEVENPAGRTVETWTESVPRVSLPGGEAGGRGSFVLHPSIADLSHGTHTLRVQGRLGGADARQEATFDIDESRINVLDDTRMVRSILGYIARDEELVALDSLSNDNLPAFWNDFWARRDPTPGTPRNESLVEFLRRVDYVDEHFAVLEPGWSSDMGRIYIRYGPPDEVDNVPYSASGPPREIWYYRTRGYRFVFIDYDGFGRYRLAGSERG